jgi:hypothetical protein
MVVGSPAVTTQPSEAVEHESTKSKRAEFDEVIPHLMQSVGFARSATRAGHCGVRLAAGSARRVPPQNRAKNGLPGDGHGQVTR